MPGGRFSVKAIFRAVDKFTAPVSRMQRRMLRFTTSARRGLRAVDRANMSVIGSLRQVGRVAGLAGLAAAAGIGSIVKTGADFEQAITNVGAVGLKSRDQIRELENQAIQLGKTTKFTATEVAAGMETMARAGFSTQEILQGIPGILSAAAASGLELAEVSNHVSNVLKGMGLATSEAARVADVLALASSKTNSTIGTLGESLKNVSSTARQMNVPLEEVVASVALLQDVGLDASVAGSAMNTMLTKLAKPSKSVAREMKRMGVAFQDSEGNMLPLPEVLNNISKGMKKSGGNMKQVAFLADLVGLRGQKAASNLAKLSEEGKVEKLTALLKDAEGAAKKMADIRMATLQGDMTLLGSAVDGVKTRLFNMNGGPLRDTIQSWTKWVSANERLIEIEVSDFLRDFTDNLPTIVKWVERLGIALAVFAAWTVAIKAAGAAMVIFEIAVKAGTIATSLYTFVSKTAAGTTWLAVVAQRAWTAALWFSNAANKGMTLSTIASTLATGFQNAAIIAVRIAATAYNAVMWLSAAAQAAFTGGAGAATTAVFGLNVALAPLLITLGAIAIAAGAAFAAVNEMNKLNAESGGLGITGIIKGMIETGKLPSEVVDDHMNKAAAADAVNRENEAASSKAIVASGDQRATESLAGMQAQLGGLGGTLTVKDETGRVEVTKQPKAGKIKLEQSSGAFE